MLYINKTSYRSPNYIARPVGTVIDALVLHTGEGTKQSDLNALTNDKVRVEDRVSAHYYVDRETNVYELVDPDYEAWHAGASSYNGRTGWNRFSIGIETEHKKGQNWPVAQKAKIHELMGTLIARYPIQEKYVAAHRWIAPKRKFDPTDWSDGELHAFIDTLFLGPSLTYQVTGLTHDMICGKGFYDLYVQLGGFNTLGYALTSEAADVDTLRRRCTWMRFERAIFKYVEGEGAHLALLIEAHAKGWLL